MSTIAADPYDLFIAAINSCTKVTLAFFSHEDDCVLIRTCAPMDFGPWRAAHDGLERYHFWDDDGDEAPHPLGLLPEQIASIQSTNERFDPADFVTWTPAWYCSRDWGQFS